MSQTSGEQELKAMLDEWPAEQPGLKEAFLHLKQRAEGLPGAATDFVARPGITNSLRLVLNPAPQGRTRPLFCMLDVVPMADEWMLSACFYADEIEDPDELGNLIPDGLLGEDGYCFDLEEGDRELLPYLEKRLAEAHLNAAIPG